MLDSATLLARLKDTFTREEFPAKSLLVKEGALAKKLFYIEAGGCRAWFRTDAGKEVTMNFGFEGSFVSSMETLLAAQPSWYNVETLEPTVAYSLPLREFQALKAAAGEWQAAYVAYLESRLLQLPAALYYPPQRQPGHPVSRPAGPPPRTASTGAPALPRLLFGHYHRFAQPHPQPEVRT